MHSSSVIAHTGVSVSRLAQPLHSDRYHSLAIGRSLPSCLEVTAWTDDSLKS
jgi:anthranilate synthase component 2